MLFYFILLKGGEASKFEGWRRKDGRRDVGDGEVFFFGAKSSLQSNRLNR